MSKPQDFSYRSPCSVFIDITFAITGLQKQSKAVPLHVRDDGVVMRHLQPIGRATNGTSNVGEAYYPPAGSDARMCRLPPACGVFP